MRRVLDPPGLPSSSREISTSRLGGRLRRSVTGASVSSQVRSNSSMPKKQPLLLVIHVRGGEEGVIMNQELELGAARAA